MDGENSSVDFRHSASGFSPAERHDGECWFGCWVLTANLLWGFLVSLFSPRNTRNVG